MNTLTMTKEEKKMLLRTYNWHRPFLISTQMLIHQNNPSIFSRNRFCISLCIGNLVSCFRSVQYCSSTVFIAIARKCLDIIFICYCSKIVRCCLKLGIAHTITNKQKQISCFCCFFLRLRFCRYFCYDCFLLGCCRTFCLSGDGDSEEVWYAAGAPEHAAIDIAITTASIPFIILLVSIIVSPL